MNRPAHFLAVVVVVTAEGAGLARSVLLHLAVGFLGLGTNSGSRGFNSVLDSSDGLVVNIGFSRRVGSIGFGDSSGVSRHKEGGEESDKSGELHVDDWEGREVCEWTGNCEKKKWIRTWESVTHSHFPKASQWIFRFLEQPTTFHEKVCINHVLAMKQEYIFPITSNFRSSTKVYDLVPGTRSAVGAV
eukprot:Nitzschia sp. Nitz4//scaffold189_size62959//20440//21000//NITZ4_006305-RA/size62959-exonerate_est2genome-gene-0.56-mRNA-1//-1//CDS//3329539887//4339//frame0